MRQMTFRAAFFGVSALATLACASSNDNDVANQGITPGAIPANPDMTSGGPGDAPTSMTGNTSDPGAGAAAPGPMTGTPMGTGDPAGEVPSGETGTGGMGTGGTAPMPTPGEGMGGTAGNSPMPMGGSGGEEPAPGRCGDGWVDFNGECVKELCGATACGIGQTCQAGACTAPDSTVVVEAENFAYRFNPGNQRTWYTIVEGRDVPWVMGNMTVGFPCSGPRCDDSAVNETGKRSGAGFIEIMPDTRRKHEHPMATYCGGFEQGCNHPSFDAHVKNAATFPGYKVTTEHLNAEFYPAPGEGPGIGYRVHFIEAGTYNVWSLGGRSFPESNSFHVGINQETKAPDVAAGEKWPAGTWSSEGRGLIHCQDGWTWRNVRRNDPVGEACKGASIEIQVPSAGVHTVWFTMREDGFQVDKWLATKQANFNPTGAGPAVVGRVELEGGLDAQPLPDCVGCEKFR